MAFHYLTFSLIQYDQFYSCAIKFFLKLERYFFLFLSQIRPWSTPLFHLTDLNLMVYISLYFPIIFENRSKILKSCDLLCFLLLNLHPIYFVLLLIRRWLLPKLVSKSLASHMVLLLILLPRTISSILKKKKASWH